MPRPRAERAISIHAPQWGATILGGLLQQSGINFNPRTPVGCDPLTYASCICQNVFQSTHPSGVRQHLISHLRFLLDISIHAPQWGATFALPRRGLFHVFQSTHPSGVRLISRSSSRSSREFQSTHPSGVRLVWSLPGISRCRFQSTHPSGVRHHTTTRRSNDQRYFNPRTPVGCDRVSRAWTCVGWRFQSTHPSGVRRQVNNNCLVSGVFQSTHPSGVRRCAGQNGSPPRRDFNPRTPVGCDPASGSPSAWRTISIHAPQWGATSGAPASARCVEFQSTHPSGVRQLT